MGSTCVQHSGTCAKCDVWDTLHRGTAWQGCMARVGGQSEGLMSDRGAAVHFGCSESSSSCERLFRALFKLGECAFIETKPPGCQVCVFAARGCLCVCVCVRADARHRVQQYTHTNTHTHIHTLTRSTHTRNASRRSAMNDNPLGTFALFVCPNA